MYAGEGGKVPGGNTAIALLFAAYARIAEVLVITRDLLISVYVTVLQIAVLCCSADTTTRKCSRFVKVRTLYVLPNQVALYLSNSYIPSYYSSSCSWLDQADLV